MTSARVKALVISLVVVSLVYWVGRNTEWADAKIPIPPRGEALTNPFYAAQRFSEALGARTVRDRMFTAPDSDSVIVLSAWHWNLIEGRREALERWVESGGRLVVDGTMDGGPEFQEWSGIGRTYANIEEDEEEDEEQEREPENPCSMLQEERGSTRGTSRQTRWMCDFWRIAPLTSVKPVAWALRDELGMHALRVRIGRGSVSVINAAAPFQYRALFDGDHAWLFATATQLRRNDVIHFLSEQDHPHLLTLIWQYGGPVVVLALGFVALGLWRSGVRFGPQTPPDNPARRSLAEQIRGTGQFALRHGDGEALYAASVRAFEEAARRRIPGYAHLPAKDRGAALARATGFAQDALLTAVYHPNARRPNELRNTIALLEAARRTLTEKTGSSHGTH